MFLMKKNLHSENSFITNTVSKQESYKTIVSCVGFPPSSSISPEKKIWPQVQPQFQPHILVQLNLNSTLGDIVY